jgi:putative DNA primase/helicase
LTAPERDQLHKLFETFDSVPKVEFVTEELAPKGVNLTPGDDYNAKVTWEQILEPLGLEEGLYQQGRRDLMAKTR